MEHIFDLIGKIANKSRTSTILLWSIAIYAYMWTSNLNLSLLTPGVLEKIKGAATYSSEIMSLAIHVISPLMGLTFIPAFLFALLGDRIEDKLFKVGFRAGAYMRSGRTLRCASIARSHLNKLAVISQALAILSIWHALLFPSAPFSCLQEVIGQITASGLPGWIFMPFLFLSVVSGIYNAIVD